ncbi:hypothetical protein EV702DRAFT_963291 [Suillus placidus]|uniref:Uncharacterized protein n=1 Tax=Suillus placidus TaxID=48579 RepID=A0A9P7A1T6_9AGAM|nr:hypothetical protein EV702DRAFT_963291 [Suillus placidus]
MHSLNGNFDDLCAELQRMILEELVLPDLMSFVDTRTENAASVSEYMDERHKMLLQTFVEDVKGFNDLLDTTGTVISSSSALHLFQAKVNALRLHMDIYVTHKFEEEVMSYLKATEEYKVKHKSERKTEHDSSAIQKIFKLEKGDKKIDVIITDWASAIIPILQFHSTVVMNYITARTLVSLYPNWMKENRGLVNPCMYLDNTTNLRTVLALMKYVNRGFDLSAEPFDLGVHNCDMSRYCPRATRNTIDGDTLHWDFKKIKTMGETAVACQNMSVVTWQLGGEDCEEDGDQQSLTYIGVGA